MSMTDKERIERLEKQVRALMQRPPIQFHLQGAEAPVSRLEAQTQMKWYERSESLIKSVGTIVSRLVGAASFFYILGFVIVNIHFGTFGVRDLSLGKVTYLSAGISFVLIHLLIVVPLLFGALTARVFRAYPLAIVVVVIICGVINYGSARVILDFLTTHPIAPTRWATAIRDYAMWVSIVSCLVVVAVTPMGSTVGKGISRLAANLVAGSAPMALILGLSTWATTIYPQMEVAFGGGRPAPIQLVVSDQDKTEFFTDIGLELVGDNLTDLVYLVDETPTTLLVQLANGKMARVDKSLISNVLYATVSPRAVLWPVEDEYY